VAIRYELCDVIMWYVIGRPIGLLLVMMNGVYIPTSMYFLFKNVPATLMTNYFQLYSPVGRASWQAVARCNNFFIAIAASLDHARR